MKTCFIHYMACTEIKLPDFVANCPNPKEEFVKNDYKNDYWDAILAALDNAGIDRTDLNEIESLERLDSDTNWLTIWQND